MKDISEEISKELVYQNFLDRYRELLEEEKSVLERNMKQRLRSNKKTSDNDVTYMGWKQNFGHKIVDILKECLPGYSLPTYIMHDDDDCDHGATILERVKELIYK